MGGRSVIAGLPRIQQAVKVMKSEISRRKLLRNSMIIGCSAAASPLFTPVVLAATPFDRRLVVIVLRGGMDGLDVVQPYGDRNFSGFRKQLKSGEAAGAHDLDGFFALHADLAELMSLWKAGELGFAHAVSTPYRDKRSHFDGQDFLENGGVARDGSLTRARDGWLNRMLGLIPGASAATAYSVGRQPLLLLNGEAAASSWSPDSDLKLSPQAQLLLEQIYAQDVLFQESVQAAFEISEKLDNAMNPRNAAKAKALASFAADRLNEETRIAAFSIGGWDTHRNQKANLRGALGELSSAILTLKSRLGRNWDNTTVLAMTEFGRTVRENGSGGTDHGTGGAMVMAGGAVKGGKVYGQWPGLGELDLYQGRDLEPTADVRSYAAWAIRDMFGLERSVLETHVFPGLDMGSNPNFIR